MLNPQHLSDLIKIEAHKLGFFFCGISKAEFLEDEAPKLENWLKQGFHGKMSYMENHFDKRLDPRKLVDGAKSVVSLALNYFPEKEFEHPQAKISKYAYGRDYHQVIKGKLKVLLETLQEQVGEVGGRAFVDSAPLLDKTWAQRSGFGWMGKNTNLINKEAGSFFFLAELVLDLELAYDPPHLKDYCGTCTRCLDACPTDAIVAPYVVDGSRCISYLTIELKEAIPEEFAGKMQGWAFGCDICQDVCPWNRFSKAHAEPAFQPLAPFQDFSWDELTEEVFAQVFKESPLRRSKYSGIRRNLDFLKKAPAEIPLPEADA